jgi:hypothetical protein
MDLKTYSLVGTALCSISPIVERLYLACVRLKGVDDKAHFSGKNYLKAWRGSVNGISPAIKILDVLGLVERYTDTKCGSTVSVKVLPIENSWLYQYVLSKMSFSVDADADLQTHAGILEYLETHATVLEDVEKLKNEPISSKMSTEAQKGDDVLKNEPISSKMSTLAGNNIVAEVEIGAQTYSKLSTEAQKGDDVLIFERDKMIRKDMLSNICLLESDKSSTTTYKAQKGAFLENENMERPKNVKYIWQSWNDFAVQHKPYLKKTPMPHCLAVNNFNVEPSVGENNRALYETIAEWINKNQNWEEIWECFMEVAESNTWLQGRHGVQVTLAFIFRLCDKEGHELPEGRVLERAINGKYSQWNKQINIGVQKDGSLSDEAVNEKVARIEQTGQKVFMVVGDSE